MFYKINNKYTVLLKTIRKILNLIYKKKLQS